MYALLNKFNIYFQNKKFNIFGKTKLPKNSTGNPVLKYARHARAGAGLLHGAVFSGLISYPGTMVLILCSCRSSRVLKFPIIWFFRLYENSIQKPPYPYKSWIFNAIWVNCHHRFENKWKNSNNFQVVDFTLYEIPYLKLLGSRVTLMLEKFIYLDDFGTWIPARIAAHGRVNMYL